MYNTMKLLFSAAVSPSFGSLNISTETCSVDKFSLQSLHFLSFCSMCALL